MRGNQRSDGVGERGKMPVVVGMIIIWAVLGMTDTGTRTREQRRNGIAGPRSGRSDGEGERRTILWGYGAI